MNRLRFSKIQLSKITRSKSCFTKLYLQSIIKLRCKFDALSACCRGFDFMGMESNAKQKQENFSGLHRGGRTKG